MGQFSFISFIRSQWTKMPSLKPTDLSERTVMIVGANVGLGLEAIRHFAAMPQPPKHLILACRSKSKGEAAIEDVKKTTGYTVELLIVDMASFASVSAFATAFQEKYDRLDVLLLNAAVVQPAYEATVDGLDINTQVNHLSTMLIALLLLPVMQRTASTHNTFPHLALTSSEMHYMANMAPELVDSPAPIARLASKEHSTKKDLATRYELTKMLNMLFVRGLTSHLPPSSAIVVCGVNPGFCHSGIRRNIKFPMTILTKLMEVTLARETSEGAKTLVHAGITGLSESDRSEREAMRAAYMSDCRPEEPSDFLFSEKGKAFECKV